MLVLLGSLGERVYWIVGRGVECTIGRSDLSGGSE